MIRIYSYGDSTNAIKPRFLLEEAGVPYETVRIDLMAGQQRRPDYLEINPFGVVPVVEIDGERLYESNAILRYLARRFHPALYSIGNAVLCQRIDMWMDLASIGYRGRVVAHEQATVLRYRNPAAAPTAEQTRPHLERALEFLRACERLHAGSPWCAGDFSIADIAWSLSLDRLLRMSPDLSSVPKVAAWAAAVAARPAYGRARARE